MSRSHVFEIAGPARGEFARIADSIVERVPGLARFDSLVMFEGSLHVTAKWSNGLTPGERRAAVASAAAEYGTEVQTRAGDGEAVTFTVVNVDGHHVVVEATCCRCHDGPAVSR